jgi:hypothetical protein
MPSTQRSLLASRLPVTNLDNFPEARFWIASGWPTNREISDEKRVINELTASEWYMIEKQ